MHIGWLSFHPFTFSPFHLFTPCMLVLQVFVCEFVETLVSYYKQIVSK
ncbi:hypothetical protein HMPREF1991_01935 [Hoylesella loescheii DSM 19665 = JCM 12249 = ATCC 15930]|uniref:Uncharacterized protein n=1 Tax=Hoylesella loescheii DSM 19665 = JCM 12249 = ATCC 15930 TaxID=1122985 RepID=A0A069QGH7_HOYLO|nr:hypothetical protein HMPREF1991_01935 [Hoylesella loescheii DSM 19665 = JCM 12249 = ATCC 15930]